MCASMTIAILVSNLVSDPRFNPRYNPRRIPSSGHISRSGHRPIAPNPDRRSLSRGISHGIRLIPRLSNRRNRRHVTQISFINIQLSIPRIRNIRHSVIMCISDIYRRARLVQVRVRVRNYRRSGFFIFHRGKTRLERREMSSIYRSLQSRLSR